MAFGFLQSATDGAALTTYTFSSQNLGTAASDRFIIATITARRATPATTISSVTIGGVTADVIIEENNTGAAVNLVAIVMANVPSGTTGDVVVTWGTSVLRCSISLYRVDGISVTTAYDTGSSNTSDPSVALDIPDGGFAVAIAAVANNTTCNWTGLSEDSEAFYDSQLLYSAASASGMSAETGRTIQADIGTNTQPVMAAAAWAVGGGGGGVDGALTGGAVAVTSALAGAPEVTGAITGGATAVTAALAGTPEITGALTGGAVGITAALSSNPDVTGALTGGAVGVTGGLVGTPEVIGTVSGAIAVTGSLAGTVEVTGALAGSVAVSAALAGTPEVVGVLSGSIAVTGNLSGTVSGAVTGTLQGTVSVAASLAGRTSIIGILAGTVAVTASLSGTAGEAETTEIPVDTAVRDAIVAALQAAQITVDGVPVTVTRARAAAVPEGERPLLNVAAGDEIQTPDTNMTTLHRMRILLTGYVAAATEEDAERDASEMRARAVRALIRPDPDGIPLPITLADDATEVWLTEVAFRVEPASIVESEAPMADCLVELAADVRMPLGNPFITV